ncbi:MAG: cytidine deaminase [candidate division WOR-3 bacterium]
MKRIEKLIKSAQDVLKFAYAPYSKFKVGAAILTKKGKIYTGANIENVSYGLSICAERIALYKALVDGAKDFSAIAIYTPTKNFTYPCGACRQVLAEFNPNIYVLLINQKGAIKQFTLSQLLSFPFLKRHLK